jgi:hypothetical protein
LKYPRIHSWDFTVESLYWRSSSSVGIFKLEILPVVVLFILEAIQGHLEYLYWRSTSWNIYTGGLPVQFGIFILEVIQCYLEYLYWRSSSATWNLYTGGHPVPLGIFILKIFQCL